MSEQFIEAIVQGRLEEVGFAALQCRKAPPYRGHSTLDRGYAAPMCGGGYAPLQLGYFIPGGCAFSFAGELWAG